MRITCPSCGAQYEIDASLLPQDGREVQCSACGTVWFQEGKTSVEPFIPEPAPLPQPPEQSAEEPAPEEAPPAPQDDEDQAAVTAPPEPAPEMQPDPQEPTSARKIDPKVLSVLREEADFEATQRALEAEGLESQPDLGLTDTAPWPPAAAQLDPSEDVSDTPEAAVQSDVVFPDIDAISSTLEPIGETRHGAEGGFALPDTPEVRQRSFITGLMIPIALAFALIAIYLGAPTLSEMVPAIEGPLGSFVALIDGLRQSLAALLPF